jgi:hypothetical protein
LSKQAFGKGFPLTQCHDLTSNTFFVDFVFVIGSHGPYGLIESHQPGSGLPLCLCGGIRFPSLGGFVYNFGERRNDFGSTKDIWMISGI